MADGDLADLDALYAAKLQDFTPLRTKLAAEAKKRGDAEAAKQITAARKPTTAAHAVNVLVLNDASVRQRLTDLGERLRAAHAGMDGGRIRELTAEQRRLIDELVRAAFKELSSTRRPRCATTSPLPCRQRSPTPKSLRGSAGSPKPNNGRASASSATPQSFSSPPAAASPNLNPRQQLKSPPSPATIKTPRNVAGGTRQRLHWPPPNAPRPRPTTR